MDDLDGVEGQADVECQWNQVWGYGGHSVQGSQTVSDSRQSMVAAAGLQAAGFDSQTRLGEGDLVAEACNGSHRRLHSPRLAVLNWVSEAAVVALRPLRAAQGQTLPENDQRPIVHEVHFFPVVELRAGIGTPDVGRRHQYT